MSDNAIFLGKSDKREELFLPLANRHGLVTGATGTGKTVTLQIMAESFCKAGVPVFAADVKGDLAGISQAGTPLDALMERAKKIDFDDYGLEATPTIFWDLFGEQGHPIRTTVTEMGPLICRASWAFRKNRRGHQPRLSASPIPKAWTFVQGSPRLWPISPSAARKSHPYGNVQSPPSFHPAPVW